MAETSQAKPIDGVRDISAITYGFMASKALFAALDFDLFTHIGRGADAAVGLAKAIGLSENLLLTLLPSLCCPPADRARYRIGKDWSPSHSRRSIVSAK
jgi:hypothetical protein